MKNYRLGIPIPKLLLLIMRITFFLFVLSVVQSYAASTYAQTTPLTSQENEIELGKLLNKIEEQTDFYFFYNNDLIDKSIKVNVNIKSKSISDVLDIALKNTGITYLIKDKEIVLNLQKATVGQQQRRLLTGVVVDERGEPVIGANVMEKGTSNGVITDIDGNFSISVASRSLLQVTYIGYINHETTVNNQKNIQIVLKEDSQSLEEVVVVGYGTMKKINLTGAIGNVKSDRIANKPITSLATALAGEAAGVTVTQDSGQPGAGQGSIRIRGVGTWEDASPLVLVDGISMSINDVIPSEVESVTVLKDAASASIYGSRAANGVILVTTKQGQKGKIRLSYDGNVGVQFATRLPEMADSWEYAEMYNQAMTNEGRSSSLFPQDRIERMRAGGDPDKLEGNTNWYKALLKTGSFQHIHQVSASGGNELFSYMGSLGYSGQDGIIPSTSYERYNARLNTNTQFTNWLKLGFNLSYLNSTQKESAAGASDAFRRIGRSLPYMPVRFSDGTWSYSSAPTNPVRRVSEDYGMKKNFHNATVVHVSPELTPIKGLLIKGIFGYESKSFLEKKFEKTVAYDAFEPAGQAATTEQSRNKQTDKWELYRNLTANATATYDFSVKKNNFKVMVGGSVETFKYAITEASRQDFPNNDFEEINAGDPSTAVAGGNSSYSALASLFGRLNYDYAGRYLLEANVRYDGSSRFARGNRWGIFPSFSAGWRISEEAFFHSLRNRISNLKVRASYGQLGNQNIKNHQFLSTVGSGENYLFGNTISTGYKESSMGNAIITWETSTSLNVGVDMTVLNDRLNLAFDYYNRTTDDILLPLPSPTTLGIEAPVQNAGTVRNKGWELTLGWRDVIGKEFNYFVNLNLSDVRNKITDLRGYKSPTGDLTTRIEGEPINSLFGWKTLGICETQEQLDTYSALMKTYNPNWGLGDIIIENRNDDNKIDADDKTVIGNSIPRYTFGINLGFDYKGFDFSCFLQGVGKADGYVVNEALAPLGINTVRKDHYTDTFNPADPQSGKYYPRVMQSYNYNYSYFSHWVQNAAYVRLKNLQLGYTFKLASISKLRIYLSGENLFTLTKFRTWDPETPVGGSSFYPNVTVCSFGVNLSL